MTRRSRSARRSSSRGRVLRDPRARDARAIGPPPPTTAQSSSSERSAGSSASSRAATRPCSVAGRSRRPSVGAASERLDVLDERDELLDEERVAAAALEQEVDRLVVGEPPNSA